MDEKTKLLRKIKELKALAYYSKKYNLKDPTKASVILSFAKEKNLFVSGAAPVIYNRLQSFCHGFDGKCECIVCMEREASDGFFCEYCFSMLFDIEHTGNDTESTNYYWKYYGLAAILAFAAIFTGASYFKRHFTGPLPGIGNPPKVEMESLLEKDDMTEYIGRKRKTGKNALYGPQPVEYNNYGEEIAVIEGSNGEIIGFDDQGAVSFVGMSENSDGAITVAGIKKGDSVYEAREKLINAGGVENVAAEQYWAEQLLKEGKTNHFILSYDCIEPTTGKLTNFTVTINKDKVISVTANVK